MSEVRLLDHWSPPDGAGDAVAALATTFTFSADFFAQDCLSRFLQLSTVSDEGDDFSVIAALLEEEDRLNDAQVTVLIDRSSPAEKRNLRSDILPVGTGTGLLHAKVAILMWERATRVILGSANLTEAGYRRQVEAVVALDLDADCGIPEGVATDISTEIRTYVERAAGPVDGPRARALATLDLFDSRVGAMDLGNGRTGPVRLAVSPSGPGRSPLDRLDEVWRGARPLRATVQSPFWDGKVDGSALTTIGKLLGGRPSSARFLTAVVAEDRITGAVKAPAALADHTDVELVLFDPPDDEIRTLHAKTIVVESDEWLAALIGSSNATRAGLGLDAHRGHAELNLWFGCPIGSALAKQLAALVRPGAPIDLATASFELEPDEDEPTTPELPTGFLWATIDAGAPAVEMSLAAASLPSTWRVTTPTGAELLESGSWNSREYSIRVPLKPGDPLPPYLEVRWTDATGTEVTATWPANVTDRAALPPPSELAGLPVEVLLAALASSRPLPVAVEHELRQRAAALETGDLDVTLDPHKRFDDSRTLLRRTRRASLALWRLGERLARPAASVDTVRWRLHGPVGPLAIADGLVEANDHGRLLPGEPHFLMAELALTIAGVDWDPVLGGEHRRAVRSEVLEVVAELRQRFEDLPPTDDDGLQRYVDDALGRAAA